MASDDLITYMGYLWLSTEDGVLTIGINDDGLQEFSEINGINLPAESEEVSADEVCGDLDTDQGPLNIYSAVNGTVLELNEAIVENPSLIMEDNWGDGWLLKIDPANADDLDNLAKASTNDDDSD